MTLEVNRAVMAALLLSVSSAAGAGATLPAPVVEALRDDGLPQSSLSLLVHAVDEVHPRVAHLVDVPRNPASAMKVVTTWAALNLLGPEFKWTTEVHAAGDSGNGRLEGDVYLKGSGDPFLVTEQLWRLLRTVRRVSLRTTCPAPAQRGAARFFRALLRAEQRRL